MSSVSSHEGSEKDAFFHNRGFPDGLPHRYAAMRKIDLLDAFDAARPRDTDTWSVAATIDDQESVISGIGGASTVISGSRTIAEGRETDDDRSAFDGLEGNLRDGQTAPLLNDTSLRLEALRDLDGPLLMPDNASTMTDDDKRSRSNAAEFGDDGTRSAAADFDESDTSDNETHSGPHNVVYDDISAPPQPQPSFASITKSYTELMEENEALQAKLRNLEISQKRQIEVIENLRLLTGCNEEIYGRALHLSQVSTDELERWGAQRGNELSPPAFSAPSASTDVGIPITAPMSTTNLTPETLPPSTTMDVHAFENEERRETPPIIDSRILSQRLTRLAELVTRFARDSVEPKFQSTLEEQLFSMITSSFLEVLPFGTENQQLLNLAYADQMRRFQTTLGASFATWYRRQTVQSLSLNPATKEYLDKARAELTQKLVDVLIEKSNDPEGSTPDYDKALWAEILDTCKFLSLEIHGGDVDVMIQHIATNSKYNDEVMTAIGDVDNCKEKVVKLVVSPLFIDERDMVLLPARVLVE